MPGALADFFFIAGLKGHEPAIGQAGGGGGAPPVRAEAVTESATLETPLETTMESHEEVHDHMTGPTGPPTSPPSLGNGSSLATSNLPLRIPELPSLSDIPTENTASGLFDDVLAKFSSERDEFVLTLAPLDVSPSNHTSIPRQTPTPPEDKEDRLPELHGSNPLRARTSFRAKMADLSRRASSRTGTLRRQNTNGSLFS
jgi:hypothetical protein